jgi:hypothetical protein
MIPFSGLWCAERARKIMERSMTDMPECVHHVPFDTECPKCVALKAAECDVCGQRRPLTKCWPMGIETYACAECRNDRGD